MVTVVTSSSDQRATIRWVTLFFYFYFILNLFQSNASERASKISQATVWMSARAHTHTHSSEPVVQMLGGAVVTAHTRPYFSFIDHKLINCVQSWHDADGFGCRLTYVVCIGIAGWHSNGTASIRLSRYHKYRINLSLAGLSAPSVLDRKHNGNDGEDDGNVNGSIVVDAINISFLFYVYTFILWTEKNSFNRSRHGT